MTEASARQSVLEAVGRLTASPQLSSAWGSVSCRVDDSPRFIVAAIDACRENPVHGVPPLVSIREPLSKGDAQSPLECRLHAAAYRARPEAAAVIHLHVGSLGAVTIAGFDCLDPRPQEMAVLGGTVPMCAYALPDTGRLAQNVETALTGIKQNVLLLMRHGALVLGADGIQALACAETLERVCSRAVRIEPFQPPVLIDPQPIIDTIRMFHPEYRFIRPIVENIVKCLSLDGKTIIPMLEDTARYIGIRIPSVSVESSPFAVRAAAEGCKALFIRSFGALALASTEAEAERTERILNWECAAQLNARSYGRGAPLALIDRQILRSGYSI